MGNLQTIEIGMSNTKTLTFSHAWILEDQSKVTAQIVYPSFTKVGKQIHLVLTDTGGHLIGGEIHFRCLIVFSRVYSGTTHGGMHGWRIIFGKELKSWSTQWILRQSVFVLAMLVSRHRVSVGIAHLNSISFTPT